jgi:DNA-directed RNA polymerase I, II, and III subunit RPABC2
MQHNSDEIEQLSTVVRDSMNNIIDPFHKTMPILTQYEKARCLGIRAVQIEHGAIPYIQVQEHIIDPYLIAEMELKHKKLPLIIKRPLPGGAFEYWKLTDLEIIT